MLEKLILQNLMKVVIFTKFYM